MTRPPLADIYPDAVLETIPDTAVQRVAWYGADRDTAEAAEYAALREGRGVIDRSWRSRIRLAGPDSRAFLQGMVTQDVAGMPDAATRRACMLDPTGHVIADMDIHAAGDDLYVDCDPRCAAPLLAILDRYLITEDVEIDDVTAQYSVVRVPTGSAPSETAADLLVFPARAAYPAVDLWLPQSDSPFSIPRGGLGGSDPVGAVAEEIARVEDGDPAWGAELTPSVLFPETEMEDAVSRTKGCYIGQEIVARIDARGHANRLLRRFRFDDAVAAGDTLHAADDPAREVGRITSAVCSPIDKTWTALGYIRREHADDGITVLARVGSDRAADVRGVVDNG